MDDRVDGVLDVAAIWPTMQDLLHQIAVPDIPVYEAVPTLTMAPVLLVYVRQALEIAGVGKEIQVDHVDVCIRHYPAYEVRANEPRAARDDNSHRLNLPHSSPPSCTL